LKEGDKTRGTICGENPNWVQFFCGKKGDSARKSLTKGKGKEKKILRGEKTSGEVRSNTET